MMILMNTNKQDLLLWINNIIKLTNNINLISFKTLGSLLKRPNKNLTTISKLDLSWWIRKHQRKQWNNLNSSTSLFWPTLTQNTMLSLISSKLKWTVRTRNMSRSSSNLGDFNVPASFIRKWCTIFMTWACQNPINLPTLISNTF